MQARPSKIRRWSLVISCSAPGQPAGRALGSLQGGLHGRGSVGTGLWKVGQHSHCRDKGASAEETASKAFSYNAEMGFWGAEVPAFLPSGGVGHSLSFPPQGQGWWD